jgi:hypothetical protein
MITLFEKIARIKEYYTISKEELTSLILVTFSLGFIFSIQFPGDSFTLVKWCYYFVLASIIAACTIFLRLSVQKIQGLWRGYFIEFKPWWPGVVAGLILAFISQGYLTIAVLGTVTSTFMVRHRLGEFRYGYSFSQNAFITNWGILINIYLATMFAVLLYIFPGSFIFKIGIILNLVMAFCQLLPLPWTEGLQIFFGNRGMYGAMWFYLISVAALLATQTKIGLIIVIIIQAIVALINLLWGDV